MRFLWWIKSLEKISQKPTLQFNEELPMIRRADFLTTWDNGNANRIDRAKLLCLSFKPTWSRILRYANLNYHYLMHNMKWWFKYVWFFTIKVLKSQATPWFFHHNQKAHYVSAFLGYCSTIGLRHRQQCSSAGYRAPTFRPSVAHPVRHRESSSEKIRPVPAKLADCWRHTIMHTQLWGYQHTF